MTSYSHSNKVCYKSSNKGKSLFHPNIFKLSPFGGTGLSMSSAFNETIWSAQCLTNDVAVTQELRSVTILPQAFEGGTVWRECADRQGKERHSNSWAMQQPGKLLCHSLEFSVLFEQIMFSIYQFHEINNFCSIFIPAPTDVV